MVVVFYNLTDFAKQQKKRKIGKFWKESSPIITVLKTLDKIVLTGSFFFLVAIWTPRDNDENNESYWCGLLQYGLLAALSAQQYGQ